MTQKAASKKKTVSMKAFSSVLIVFGVLEGKQRAGTFAEADVELAKKAAVKLGLSTMDVTDALTKELATKVRPGNPHANASGFLPVATQGVYAKLTDGTPGKDKGSKQSLRRPRNWSEISIGDVVISQDTDPEEGFWSARVLLVKGDLLTLQWQTRSEKKSFKKHKLNVALLWPGEDFAPDVSDAKEPKSAYPATWKSIGVGALAVAPEVGPLRQYWFARVVEVLDEDRLKMEWDGYPDAPQFEQSRHSVALMYPIPGAAPAKRRKTP